MKTDIMKKQGSVIELTASLSKDEFEPYWRAFHEAALEKVHLKGFRQGTAPKELADGAIDKEKVFSEAVDRAVRESLRDLTEENSWTIIAKPEVEVLDAENGGLRFKTILTVFPEVKLGDYKKIAIDTRATRQAVVVEKKEIEKAFNWIRDSRAAVTRVSRPAEKGDLMEVDVSSFENGAPLPNGEMKGDRFVLGESRYMPGFDEKLVGHKEGEEVKFQLMPPVDYWQKDLRGKQIDFSVKLNGVFSRALPELTDEFVKSLGPNFKNIAALEENMKQGLMVEKEEQETERIRAKMIEEIIKTTEADIPKIMIDRILDQLFAEVKQMMPASPEFSDEKLRASLQPKARERALANLVLYQIEKQEHLEPTRAEVEEEAKKLNLDPETSYDYAYGILRHRKVFGFLEKQ